MTLIDGMLILAPLAVVPLARPLLAHDRFPDPRLMLAAALSFALAFGLPQGWGAALTLPWLVIAATAALLTAYDALARGVVSITVLALVVAHGFLVVSAFFSLASRAGWVIADTYEPITELTGVHFAYAGFAALTLGMRVARAARVPRRIALTMLTLGIVAPPITATGFTARWPINQIGGAVLMTAFTWTIAGLTFFCVARHTHGTARVLLTISSVAVLAPMVLGVFWAAAQYYSVPALSIPDMARLHGTLNGFGFIGCGLLGWRAYADLRSSTTRVQRSGSLR